MDASHYLVIDLEATCDRRGFPRDQSEIIEIGAVLVDPHMQPVDEFQTFVKPVVRPWLTDFCTELTSIRQEDVDAAPTFRPALAALADWMPAGALFCSWGAYDRNQFRQDARRLGVRLPFGGRHFNVKAEFAAKRGAKPCGMKGALRAMGIPLDGTHHRGIDDARNIAKLLPYALGRTSFPSRPPDGGGRSRR